MRAGVALQPVDDPQMFREFVTEIDALGFDQLWLTDSSLHARYVYSYLTLASTWAPRLHLGTAVTNPLTRHPAVTAIAASTLDLVSEGRFTLGIGAGDRPLLSLGLKPAPLGVLERSILDIRRLWAGIPIYISASGPATLRMAGRIADGVILLCGLDSDVVAWALSRIDEGVSEANRSSRPHVAIFAYGAVIDDSVEAMRSARTIAAWFPQTVPQLCEVAGLSSEIVAKVQQSYQGGEFQEAETAAALLPVDFVKRMALYGGVDEAREHIRNLTSMGVDSINVFPLGTDRMATIRGFAEALKKEGLMPQDESRQTR